MFLCIQKVVDIGVDGYELLEQSSALQIPISHIMGGYVDMILAERPMKLFLTSDI